MTLNIEKVTRTLDLVWMPYRGAHLLNGLLPEDSHPKLSHVVTLGNN